MTKILALTLLFAVASSSFAAKKPVEVSNLSGFKGNYSGRITVLTGNIALRGTARAKITSMKKKERGSITLTSTPSAGMTAVVWNETLAIRNKSLKYAINAAGTLAVGSGRANVKTKTIIYSATFQSSAGLFFVHGTVTKVAKKKLKITETINGPATFAVTYSLTKRGK